MSSLSNMIEELGISEQQETVLQCLTSEPGVFMAAAELCDVIYDEHIGGDPAPAKLRVLMQRCRAVVASVSKGRSKIVTRRGVGWKMTRRDVAVFKTCLAKKVNR